MAVAQISRQESPNSAAVPNTAASLFVWAAWVLMLVATLAYVAKYAVNVPFWDDWHMVPALTGEQPVTLAWLWDLHNEHRIALPKLILLMLLRGSGADFRAGMFFNVILLALAALMLIRTANVVRGRTIYADAFFPVLLLNWSQWENFFISFTINLVLPTVLTLGVLAIIVHSSRAFTGRHGIATGICLVLLPLCGANGVAMVPPLALWLAIAVALHWRAPSPLTRRDALLTLSLAGSALLLSAFYFYGFKRPENLAAVPTVPAALRTSLQILSLLWGRGGEAFWPVSPLAAAGVLLAGALLALAMLGKKDRAQRTCTAGLLLLLGGIVCLALVIGWGRAALGPGFQSRYVTLVAPALCCVYFIWSLYGPLSVRDLAQMVLFAAVLSLLALNARYGMDEAWTRREKVRPFRREALSGASPSELAHHHVPTVYHSPGPLANYIRMLQRAGIAPYDRLRPETDHRP